MRGKIEAKAGISEQEAKAMALKDADIKKWLVADTKKVVFVKDKLINFVI